ncbi:MAG: hypothetical protein GXY34_05535 [Syntrophomonadaceae bacterium]|nr:hypothetical protein [Syntrophomonadaceae bacterium]
MRRNFPILLLLVAFVLFTVTGSLAAAEVPSWELTLRDDGRIAERVTLSVGTSYEADEWNNLQSSDPLVLERVVNDWPAYMEFKDRLPLQMLQKNYIIWQDVEINKNSAVSSTGAAAAVLSQDNSKIIFRVPGIINAHAGNQVTEEQVEVSALEARKLADGQAFIQATTFDGLMMGIVLFVLGFLVVGIVFMNRIRKVNRLIEEEYSLERAHEQLELEEKELREQQEVQEQNPDENKEDE